MRRQMIWQCEMHDSTRSRLSWAAVVAGVLVILGGCIFSIALRNPGGPVVPIREAQRAIRLAYMACALGATIAIGVPALLSFVGRVRNSRSPEEANQGHKK